MFFVPMQAKAGFFSSLFGTNVSADAEGINPTEDTLKTSQNRDLSLQANVSSALVIEDKNTKDDKSGLVKENASVNIVSDNALSPATSVMGASGSADGGDVSSDDVSVYVIRKDDSIGKIAEMFGVSSNTILWANDMKKGDKLVEGDVLIILPVSGVKHTVTKGQTLKGIANLYKVDVTDIAGFNGISTDAELAVGDELIIPDAEMSDEGGDNPAPNIATSSKIDQDYYANHSIKDVSGYFINPLPVGPNIVKTQGLHDHGRAIDIGAPKGTPIYASASGRILFAKVGYNGGYGNLVIIQHSNGTQTYYAHQSKLVAHTGDQVAQGEVIGYVGSTGHSTGPHLHFEVRGARNPAATNWY